MGLVVVMGIFLNLVCSVVIWLLMGFSDVMNFCRFVLYLVLFVGLVWLSLVVIVCVVVGIVVGLYYRCGLLLVFLLMRLVMMIVVCFVCFDVLSSLFIYGL